MCQLVTCDVKLTVDAAAFDGWELDAKKIGLEIENRKQPPWWFR